MVRLQAKRFRGDRDCGEYLQMRPSICGYCSYPTRPKWFSATLRNDRWGIRAVNLITITKICFVRLRSWWFCLMHVRDSPSTSEANLQMWRPISPEFTRENILGTIVGFWTPERDVPWGRCMVSLTLSQMTIRQGAMSWIFVIPGNRWVGLLIQWTNSHPGSPVSLCQDSQHVDQVKRISTESE